MLVKHELLQELRVIIFDGSVQVAQVAHLAAVEDGCFRAAALFFLLLHEHCVRVPLASLEFGGLGGRLLGSRLFGDDCLRAVGVLFDERALRLGFCFEGS